MNLKSQEMRKLAPELDPLRIGTGWKKEDLGKPQIMVESTYGDSCKQKLLNQEFASLVLKTADHII